MLKSCLVGGSCDASSTSPESVNVSIHDFVIPGCQPGDSATAACTQAASINHAASRGQAALIQRFLLFTLDLVLLVGSACIIAAAYVAGWRPRTPQANKALIATRRDGNRMASDGPDKQAMLAIARSHRGQQY